MSIAQEVAEQVAESLDAGTYRAHAMITVS